MKRITKTITSREVVARVYNHENDTLDTINIESTGEKFTGLEKRYGRYEVLKVLEVKNESTLKYAMTVDRFTQFATESDIYMHGFINRKIGGKVAVCKIYDLDKDSTDIIELENATEKQLSKTIENEYNGKLLKVLEVKNVDEKFYFMSDEDFIAYAEIN